MGQVKGLGLDIQREPCCNAERSGSNEGLDLLSERQTAKINDNFLNGNYWKIHKKAGMHSARQNRQIKPLHFITLLSSIKGTKKLYILGLLNSISAWNCLYVSVLFWEKCRYQDLCQHYFCILSYNDNAVKKRVLFKSLFVFYVKPGNAPVLFFIAFLRRIGTWAVCDRRRQSGANLQNDRKRMNSCFFKIHK